MTQPIKDNAELRHVLAHILYAIEELANGRPKSALHEIESVEGLVFFREDGEMEGYLDGLQQEEKAEAAPEAETQEEIAGQRRPGARNPGKGIM